MSIKPALTAEEWRDDAVVTGATDAISDAVESWYRPPPGDYTVQMIDDSLHRAAALALNRQVFGFTWEDVDDELRAAAFLEAHAAHLVDTQGPNGMGAAKPYNERAARHRDRADRIESLLPARET